MKKLKVVTDSSATMDPKLRDQYEIHVIPLSIMIDDTIYTDDDHLTGEKFVEMMNAASELPKTSQPPIGKFIELYDELGKDGSEILSIHMTSSLSGTVEAARQAAQITKSKVTVIDSEFTDQALAFAVIEAAKCAQAGESLEDVLPKVKRQLEHTRLFIGLASLENLVKGGRISRAKGMLSSFLNIRVVMEFIHAELIPIVKGRGNKTILKWFEDLKEELKKQPTVQKIGISYVGDPTQMLKFKEELAEIFPQIAIDVLHTTPIIATHTGEGAFAIMYYTAN